MPEAWIRREAVANHRAWMAARSLAMGGGPERVAGFATTLVPGGEACLPFPDQPTDRAGDALDAWMERVRALGAVSAAVWGRSEEGQYGLGPRLVAR
ncbi:MAG: hypothetical protein ACKO5K_05530, partial [Armatimonadota bacterium]